MPTDSPPIPADAERRRLAENLALAIIHATKGDPSRVAEAASVILASPLAALREASAPGGSAEAIRERCLRAVKDSVVEAPTHQEGEILQRFEAAIRALPLDGAPGPASEDGR